jgi:hypothetical protein
MQETHPWAHVGKGSVNAMVAQFDEDDLHAPVARHFEPYGDEGSLGVMTFAAKESQGTESCRRSSLWGFAFHDIAGRLARISETRRSLDQVGRHRTIIGIGNGIGGEERLKEIRRGNARLVKGVMVIQHPPGQQGFGRLLNPLIDQNSDFTAQVRSVIQPRELKTLQGGGGCLS